MKAIITLIFVLFFGVMALAQNTKYHDTIQPLKMDIVLGSGIGHLGHLKEIKTPTQKSVVRLYKYKYSRVTRALSFATKKDKPKLA